MIVRVLGDGQYEVGDDVVRRLNELDEQAMGALDADDEARLGELVRQMGDLVRAQGRRVPDDRLVPSEIVIPDSDFTLDELRKLRDEEGLIPDPPIRR